MSGKLEGAAAVAETPVQVNGKVFRLGDIATVTHGYEDPGSYYVRQKGEPALLVGVVMRKGGNIIGLGKALAQTLESFQAQLPAGFSLEQIADQPRVVEHAIGEFTTSFLEALGIVLFVSFLSLGWRTRHRRGAVCSAGAGGDFHDHDGSTASTCTG